VGIDESVVVNECDNLKTFFGEFVGSFAWFCEWYELIVCNWYFGECDKSTVYDFESRRVLWYTVPLEPV
jgi:hypothetical protein